MYYVYLQLIGLPVRWLGNALCLYINGLNVDVTAEIELKDIGAESKVAFILLIHEYVILQVSCLPFVEFKSFLSVI